MTVSRDEKKSDINMCISFEEVPMTFDILNDDPFMIINDGVENHYELRRLSTSSYAVSDEMKSSPTIWEWYWQGNDGSWNEYTKDSGVSIIKIQ